MRAGTSVGAVVRTWLFAVLQLLLLTHYGNFILVEVIFVIVCMSGSLSYYERTSHEVVTSKRGVDQFQIFLSLRAGIDILWL